MNWTRKDLLPVSFFSLRCRLFFAKRVLPLSQNRHCWNRLQIICMKPLISPTNPWSLLGRLPLWLPGWRDIDKRRKGICWKPIFRFISLPTKSNGQSANRSNPMEQWRGIFFDDRTQWELNSMEGSKINNISLFRLFQPMLKIANTMKLVDN